MLLKLEQSGGDLSGWYFYFRVGKEIRLSGTITSDGVFTLEEFASGSEKTGVFQGNTAQGIWQGSWRKAADAPAVAFSLHENRDVLDDLNGRFRCSAKKFDKQFGYTYAYALDLNVTKGTVQKIAIASTATSRYDQHQCSIDLRELKQISSDAGILLQAKGDMQNQEGGAQHCTVRILGAGDYLYVQIGDSSETRNDCKGDGGTMFCSGRGSWADMIVDRRTRACKAVE